MITKNQKKSRVYKINITDKNYPELLKEIYDAPKELYVEGNLLVKEKYPLAVVGTRRVSKYGINTTINLVENLTKNGLTIISGLALGVDGLAHQTCIDNGGKTIAVLGCGPDIIYPPSHRQLTQDIIDSGGAIVSEYPPGTRPSKLTFPKRNRIISGLSLGVLVIEAPERSGALITARTALEQGREVFAVPGSINNPNSQGTNKLIKMGAYPVTAAEDVLNILKKL